MTPRIFPSEDRREGVPVPPAPRGTIHEVTECIELIPSGEVYRTASERVK